MILKTIKFKSKWEKIDSLRLDEIDDHEIITAKFNNTHLGMISTSGLLKTTPGTPKPRPSPLSV